MNLPKIDLSTLPDLETMTGMFGSIANLGRTQVWSDDTILVMMVFFFELFPNG